MSRAFTILLSAICGAGFGFGIGFGFIWVLGGGDWHTVAARHLETAALWAGTGVGALGFIAGILWTADVTDSVPRHVPRSRPD
jgi:hypothetical protein